MNTRGEVAIVTGGASGIGLALGRALAARGATVILADVDQAGVEAAAARLGERVSGVALDVTDAAAVAALVADTVAAHGQLDLMFNNAGIAISGEARDIGVEHWRRVVEVNLMGVVHGCDAAYKQMARQGHGHIVNIASLAGLVPFPTNASYCATKHAVVGLSQSLRVEGEALGVKVSVVCPGFIATNIFNASQAINVDQQRLVDNIPFAIVPADEAARRILAGVARNRAVIVFPAYARVFWWLQRLHRVLALPLARGMMRDFRKLRLKD